MFVCPHYPQSLLDVCYVKQPSVGGSLVKVGGRAAAVCGVMQGNGDSYSRQEYKQGLRGSRNDA